MPEWLKTIIYCFAGVGFWTVSASIALWFRDRSGNSGRDTHWATNPRIDAPYDDEFANLNELVANQEPLSAEFQQVLEDNYWELVTANAMKPRDDRRDEPNGL